MPLAKLADMKSRLNATDTDRDALFTMFLTSATSRLEQLSDRPLVRQEGFIEFPYEPDLPNGGKFLRVKLWPIESIISVKQLYSAGSDDDFTAADDLVENTDYFVDKDAGTLLRVGSLWYLEPRMIRVELTGGYYDPSGAAPTADAFEPPYWLQESVIKDAIRMYQTRAHAGAREIDLGDGGGRVSLSEAKPHPDLVAAAESLRRKTL